LVDEVRRLRADRNRLAAWLAEILNDEFRTSGPRVMAEEVLGDLQPIDEDVYAEVDVQRQAEDRVRLQDAREDQR